jgi:dipeptidyl aminopeptidase/acylaminoacyl peptidase
MWLVFLLSFQLAASTVPPSKLALPYGPVKKLASPDGSRILYGVETTGSIRQTPELWIEDTRNGHQTRLLSISGTLEAEWSPNSSAFAVNDHRASDSADAYIYDAATLKRTDVADLIRTADHGTERFTNAHAYFVVDRWEGTEQVLVRFHGHTDDAPVVCFDLRYRVSRAGAVQKLSEHVSPITAKLC